MVSTLPKIIELRKGIEQNDFYECELELEQLMKALSPSQAWKVTFLTAEKTVQIFQHHHPDMPLFRDWLDFLKSGKPPNHPDDVFELWGEDEIFLRSRFASVMQESFRELHWAYKQHHEDTSNSGHGYLSRAMVILPGVLSHDCMLIHNAELTHAMLSYANWLDRQLPAGESDPLKILAPIDLRFMEELSNAHKPVQQRCNKSAWTWVVDMIEENL